MNLSLSTRVGLTIGTIIVVGLVTITAVAKFLHVPQNEFANLMVHSGFGAIAEQIRANPELGKQFLGDNDNLFLEPRSNWPEVGPEGSILERDCKPYLVVPIDSQTVLLAVHDKSKDSRPGFMWPLALTFILSIALGAVVAGRPIQRRLLRLQKRIVSLSGGEYVPNPQKDEFERVEEVLDWAEARMEKTQAERKSFLQALAHELRTPLARIGFEIDRLSRRPDQVEKTVSGIRQEIDELVELSEELTEWIEFDSEPEDTAAFDLCDAVHICVELETDRCMREDVRMSVVCPDAFAFVGRRRQLNRAVENMVRNAFRHTESRIRVSIIPDGSNVTVRVDDDGPGIPPQDRERVLEPFSTGSEDGMGLGLAIVVRTAMRHDGFVSIESNEWGGASVQMTVNSGL